MGKVKADFRRVTNNHEGQASGHPPGQAGFPPLHISGVGICFRVPRMHEVSFQASPTPYQDKLLGSGEWRAEARGQGGRTVNEVPTGRDTDGGLSTRGAGRAGGLRRLVLGLRR